MKKWKINYDDDRFPDIVSAEDWETGAQSFAECKKDLLKELGWRVQHLREVMALIRKARAGGKGIYD